MNGYSVYGDGGLYLYEAMFRSEPEYPEHEIELTSGIKVISGKKAREAIRALGSETRWDIYSIIKHRTAHIDEIARKLGKNKSTISRHVEALVKAGIVKTVNIEGSRGTRKQVCPSSNRLYLDIS